MGKRKTPNIGPNLSRIIMPLFFLSGFTALLYEVAWLQRMQLVFGNTIYAHSITLAAFLSGISLGSILSLKLVKKGYHPLYFYLAAELAISAYALLFYPILLFSESAFTSLLSDASQSTFLFTVIQFALSFATILVPTILMGTTLPLLSHFLWSTKADDKTVDLYLYNTLGGCVGCYLAGFVILPALGYFKTILFASALGVLLFFMGCRLLKISPMTPLKNLKQANAAPQAAVAHNLPLMPMAVLFLSGFASLLVQVIWQRMISIIAGPSIYIFPITTTIVLLGIVLGSKFAKKRARFEQPLVWLSILSGIFLFLGTYKFSKVPLLLPWVYQLAGTSFWGLQILEFLIFSVFLLPASFALGSLFPIAISEITDDREDKISGVSAGYFVNILGLVIGAIVGANILIPILGIETLTVLISITLVLSGAAIAYTRQYRRLQIVPAVLVAVVLSYFISFDKSVMTSGLFYNRVKLSEFKNPTFGGIREELNERIEYKDGASDTVTIDMRKDGVKTFAINGKVDGSTSPTDLATVRIAAYLPLLARDDYSKVLTIGMGTGLTAMLPLKWYPKVTESTVVEISPTVAELAKKHFPELNDLLWTDPRAKVLIRNGREFLQHSKDKYDLIISEPSNPWVNGVASLYTTEHFDKVIQHLNPNGWTLMWFHTYATDCAGVRTVLKTVAQSFKSMHVFEYSRDMYILASPGESKNLQSFPRTAALAEREFFDLFQIDRTFTRESSYRAILDDFFLFMREQALDQTSDNDIVNTDDNQRLQYDAGKQFWQSNVCNLILEISKERRILPNFTMID
jgi:spermidine synthase